MKTHISTILEQIAPLPYKADGFDITDKDSALTARLDYWDDKGEATAAYLVHCANEMPNMIAVFRKLTPYLDCKCEGKFICDKCEMEKALKQAEMVEV